MRDWKAKFHDMRFDSRYHLGMGDVRLTVAMQDELAKMQAVVNAARDIERYLSYIEEEGIKPHESIDLIRLKAFQLRMLLVPKLQDLDRHIKELDAE